MIVRHWNAKATPDGAAAYTAFFQSTLVPELDAIPGHRGALVLTRAGGEGTVDITVLTFWDSRQAIARFAGDTPDRAVVEPEARAVLISFDDQVVHRDVAIDTRRA